MTVLKLTHGTALPKEPVRAPDTCATRQTTCPICPPGPRHEVPSAGEAKDAALPGSRSNRGARPPRNRNLWHTRRASLATRARDRFPRGLSRVARGERLALRRATSNGVTAGRDQHFDGRGVDGDTLMTLKLASQDTRQQREKRIQAAHAL